MKTVNHQALKLKWPKPNEFGNIKTLVLGSFNPYNPNEHKVDYYYGRDSNHFWKSIAELTGKNENYFLAGDLNQRLERKKEVMENGFACMDVIDSIQVIHPQETIVENYITTKIFSGFKDANIWVSNTKVDGAEKKLKLVRSYNEELIVFLKESKSIKRIISSMGNNRMGLGRAEPLENPLGANGFNGYMHRIWSICEEKKIDFIFESVSPSDYAIKRLKNDRSRLNAFLKEYILD